MIFSTDAFRVRRISDASRIIEAFGELDLSSAPRLEELLLVLGNPPVTHLELDLSGVSLVDAFAMRCILRASRKLAERGCSLVVCGIRPRVRRVMEIVAFDREVTLAAPSPLAEPA